MPELKLDFDRIDTLIKDGFISKRKHPTLDLWILNYTARVQYTGAWDNETLNCRGLVVDGRNNIVSRSFQKFFNYDELPVRPEQNAQLMAHLQNGDPFTAVEKMDGSLILVFSYEGQRVVASRGSFESTQAEMARKILDEKYPSFNPEVAVGTTFLFELIHPENRIVVNYGKQEDLCYLSSVRLDGHEHPTLSGLHYSNFEHQFPEPATYQFSSIEELLGCWQSTNFEGYVIHFPSSGLRVKFKFDEYKRLHRLLTGITPKMIWEELSAGRSLEPLIEQVPDEFYTWVKKQAGELLLDYYHILVQCNGEMAAATTQDVDYNWPRKQYAEIFTKCDYPAILFRMLDGHDPKQLIWKTLKPSGEAFRCAD